MNTWSDWEYRLRCDSILLVFFRRSYLQINDYNRSLPIPFPFFFLSFPLFHVPFFSFSIFLETPLFPPLGSFHFSILPLFPNILSFIRASFVLFHHTFRSPIKHPSFFPHAFHLYLFPLSPPTFHALYLPSHSSSGSHIPPLSLPSLSTPSILHPLSLPSLPSSPSHIPSFIFPLHPSPSNISPLSLLSIPPTFRHLSLPSLPSTLCLDLSFITSPLFPSIKTYIV